MRGVFEDGEPEPGRPPRETELTLGSATLLAIFFGLVLVCGLCFGLGYALGRRGSPSAPAAAQLPAGAPTDFQGDNSRSKPSASAAPAPQGAVVNPPSPVESNPATEAASSPGQAQIRPALPTVANSPQPAQPAASKVAPALAPAVPLMVQIAAVSQQEDADVLVGALRKRGYAVTLRRDPVDGLIHVRIGPFSGPAEAEKWRLKLLNDGYNAIVQQ